MDWHPMDDEALGHTVDAWLTQLRVQGLSGQRLQALAGLLGNAMGESGPQNAAEERVLRRFDTWRQSSGLQ